MLAHYAWIVVAVIWGLSAGVLFLFNYGAHSQKTYRQKKGQTGQCPVSTEKTE